MASLKTKETLILAGIACIVALLSFLCGAIVMGSSALADLTGIPLNLKELQRNGFATKDDVAFVALDRVDKIVLYMKDGDASTDEEEEASDAATIVVQHTEQATTGQPVTMADSGPGGSKATSQPARQAQAPCATGVEPIQTAATPAPAAPGETARVVLVEQPVEPSVTHGGQATTPQTSQPEHRIFIKNVPPAVYVKVNNQPQPANYVSQNVFNDIYSTNEVYHGDVNWGIQNSIALGISASQIQGIIAEGLANGLSAEEISLRIQSATGASGNSLNLQQEVINNSHNNGIIVQGSSGVSIRQVEDVVADIDATLVNVGNTNSGNTTVTDSMNRNYDNVGNEYYNNVANDVTATLEDVANQSTGSFNTETTASSSQTNIDSGNTVQATFSDVGNDYSSATVSAEVDIAISDSGNGNSVAQGVANDVGGSSP
ncbi:MAG: hypothetical protein QHH05_01250 [Syntrophomonadaceae bacterium]|nr:hypothetical protein [Syntrophomonadaceae bacterium]